MSQNCFIERLWRSLKYEEVYLNDYDNPRQARQEIARYFDFYNFHRPHQALDYRIPAKVYFGGRIVPKTTIKRKAESSLI